MPLNYDRCDVCLDEDSGDDSGPTPAPNRLLPLPAKMSPVEVVSQAPRWHAVVSRAPAPQTSAQIKPPAMAARTFPVRRDSPAFLSRTFTQTRLQDWFSTPSQLKSSSQWSSQPSTGFGSANGARTKSMGTASYEIMHPTAPEHDSDDGEVPVPQPFIYADDSDEYFWPVPIATAGSSKRTRAQSGMDDLEVKSSVWTPPAKQARRTDVASRWAAVPAVPPSAPETIKTKLPTHCPPTDSFVSRPPAQLKTLERRDNIISISSDESVSSPRKRSKSPEIRGAERSVELTRAIPIAVSLSPSTTPGFLNDTAAESMMIESRRPDAMACCEEGDCDSCILRYFEEYDHFEEIPEVEEARQLAKRLYIDDSTYPPLPPPPVPVPCAQEKPRRRLESIPFPGHLDGHLPYLSVQDRKLFLAQLDNNSQRFLDVSPGQLVHINFSPVECKIILLSYDTSPPRLPSIYHKIGYVTRKSPSRCIDIPNRRRKDIKQFIHDCRNDPDALYEYHNISYLRYNPPSPKPTSAKIRRSKSTLLLSSQLGGSRSRENRRQHHAQLFETFKPSRIFNIGSSDVVNAIFNPRNPGQFAASCLANTDGYSRPNNLLLGNMDVKPEPTIQSLDEHKTRRPNAPATQDFIWSTVSSIGFSCDGSQLYSGSYDKTVKVWDATTIFRSTLLHSIPVSSEVNNLSSDPNRRSFAAGLKDGSITVVSLDLQLTTANIPAPFRAGKAPTPLSTTTVLYFPSYNRPWLLAGYEDDLPADTTIRNPSGYLTVFDLNTLETAFKISPNVSRNFDLCLGYDNQTFCSAVSATTQRSKSTHSHLRRYDPRVKPGYNCRPDLEFDSSQRDINRITCCETYYTSSGTDNCTWVFDERFPARHLHKLQHGPTLAFLPPNQDPEEHDTGVNFAAWMPGGNADRFLTGGSDGVVKVWDIRRAAEDAWLKDLFTTSTQIMSGSVAQNGEWVVLGEESGRVTVLGLGCESEGRDAEVPPFVNVASIGRGDRGEGESDESGVRIAREYVRSGRFIIENGAAWEA